MNKRINLCQETEEEDIDVVANDNDDVKEISKINLNNDGMLNGARTPWSHEIFTAQSTEHRFIATTTTTHQFPIKPIFLNENIPEAHYDKMKK